MKKSITIIIALLLALSIAGAVTIYFMPDNLGLLSHTVTSSDKKYSVKVPLKWKTAEPASEQSVLAAQSKNASEFVNVSVDSKYLQSGETLEDYVYGYISRIAENSDNPIVQVISVQPKEVKIGDKSGYYFELDTSAGNVMLHTWDFVFTSTEGYVHIDVAAKGDNQEQNKEIARGIMESFTIN